jgi:hypothetical protein
MVSLCEDYTQLTLSNLVRLLPSTKGHGALFLGGVNVSAENVQTAFITALNRPFAKVLSVKRMDCLCSKYNRRTSLILRMDNLSLAIFTS